MKYNLHNTGNLCLICYWNVVKLQNPITDCHHMLNQDRQLTKKKELCFGSKYSKWLIIIFLMLVTQPKTDLEFDSDESNSLLFFFTFL